MGRCFTLGRALSVTSRLFYNLHSINKKMSFAERSKQSTGQQACKLATSVPLRKDSCTTCMSFNQDNSASMKSLSGFLYRCSKVSCMGCKQWGVRSRGTLRKACFHARLSWRKFLPIDLATVTNSWKCWAVKKSKMNERCQIAKNNRPGPGHNINWKLPTFWTITNIYVYYGKQVNQWRW